MQNKVSEKQQLIIDFVNSQVEEKGYPPSVREICKAVGFKSTSTVHAYLERLEKEGLIHKDPTKPRALKVVGNHKKSPSRNIEGYVSKKELVDVPIVGKVTAGQPILAVENIESYVSKKELVDVPIVGKVTAGQPILAVENIEDTFPLPVSFVQNANAFMLKVQGDSMIEAGIFDRDLVLVKQQQTANNGDIVVALIEDEATVKTFYKESDHIRLQPENQYLEPIIVKNNLSILGKVIGVFRML